MPHCVILLSGWGVSADPMRTLAEEIGLDGACALSLRELRERGADDPSDTASPYAAGLRRELERGDGPAHVVGWSTGGIVALEASALCPDRFQTLTLLGATPKFCADDDFPHGTPLAALRAMMVGLRRDPESVLTTFAARMAEPLVVKEVETRPFVMSALAQGTDELAKGLKYLRDSDFREHVHALQAPCLVLHGREDRIVPFAAAEWLHNHAPDSQLVEFPEGGHALAAQSTVTVASRIRIFLEAHS